MPNCFCPGTKHSGDTRLLFKHFCLQLFSSKVQFLYNLLSSVALWGGPMVETKGKIALEFRSVERSKMHFSWIFLWTFRVLSGILK